MRVVIDIPEDLYGRIKDNTYSINDRCDLAEIVQKNGTPLSNDQADTITCCSPDKVAETFVEDVEAVKDLLPQGTPKCKFWNGHVCTGFHETICKYQEYNLYDFFDGKPCPVKCHLHTEEKGQEGAGETGARKSEENWENFAEALKDVFEDGVEE